MAKRDTLAQSENRPTAPAAELAAPDLPYQPRDPQNYRPGIGLVACGDITKYHLRAYKKAGYRILALCDLDLSRARRRQQEFFPHASICSDPNELLARDDIEVIDVATHTSVRPRLVEAAIKAGKHVLSQKPFVLDLDEGQRLVELAEHRGIRLAVNQNGRWAPHYSYLRQAVRRGILGTLAGVHFAVHWDHSWVEKTEFEKLRHLILYDFAIHWFDLLTCLMGSESSNNSGPRCPKRVFASLTRSSSQSVRPALLGQVMVEYDGAQSTLVFDGHTAFGRYDTTYVTGSQGTFASQGSDLHQQEVTLSTSAGVSRPKLQGDWFPDGFHGTMGELLCAIEEDREPTHSARNNLKSLELCFAAVASAERHEPVPPGSVRKMEA